MTDRQRFEKTALENNATILESTTNLLKVLATDGVLITNYVFDNDGNFKRIFR